MCAFFNDVKYRYISDIYEIKRKRSLNSAFSAPNATRNRVGVGRMHWNGSHSVDISFRIRGVSGVIYSVRAFIRRLNSF